MRLIHPLTRRGVALLARTAVEPWQVVVAHAALGLAAAVLVAGSSSAGWLVAAVLLQLKTLLDNMDGGLARATDRVTELGRYLDTGLDFLVNIALFIALAWHGPPLLAGLALVVLTFVLSYDFNAEKLYCEAHLSEDDVRPAADSVRHDRQSPALRLFKSLYTSLFAPQDEAIVALDARLFKLASGRDYEVAQPVARREWANLFSTAALVNLGLSTQYVVLGVCLLAGAPYAYVYIVLLQGVYVVVVQLLRVRSYRRRAAARSAPPGARR